MGSHACAWPQPGREGQVRGQHRVLIVEDNLEYLAIVRHELTVRGFEVRSFVSGEDLLATPRSEADDADLLILDWKLPGMTGIALLSRLRDDGCRTPVLFLTSMTQSHNEHVALDKGAVDFVPKTRGVEILVRRMARILERPEPPRRRNEARHVGELTLRTSVRRADWRGRDVGLTVCEYDVIDLLTSSEGRPVSHREIYDRIHYVGFIAGSGTDGYRCNVRSIIKRIRSKFRRLDPGFDAIGNHAGEGYSWIHVADGG